MVHRAQGTATDSHIYEPNILRPAVNVVKNQRRDLKKRERDLEETDLVFVHRERRTKRIGRIEGGRQGKQQDRLEDESHTVNEGTGSAQLHLAGPRGGRNRSKGMAGGRGQAVRSTDDA